MERASAAFNICFGEGGLYEQRSRVVENKVRSILGLRRDYEPSIEDALTGAGLDISSLSGLSWKDGYSLGSWDTFRRKTPDAILVKRDVLVVCEVSVSASPAASRVKKQYKYQLGLEAVAAQLGIELQFSVLSLCPDLSDVVFDNNWGYHDWAAEVEDVRQINAEIEATRERLSNEELEFFNVLVKAKMGQANSRPENPASSPDYEYTPTAETLQEFSDCILQNSSGLSDSFSAVSKEDIQRSFEKCRDNASQYTHLEGSRAYCYACFSRNSGEVPATVASQHSNIITASEEVRKLDFKHGGIVEDVFSILSDSLDAMKARGTELFSGSESLPPGCFKSSFAPKSMDHIRKWLGKDQKEPWTPKPLESLSWDQDSLDGHKKDVEGLIKTLSSSVVAESARPKVMGGKTLCDISLGEMIDKGLSTRVLEPVMHSRAYHASIVSRDLSEWLIAQSGNKRSKRYSGTSFCGGLLVVIKLPGKGAENTCSRINTLFFCSESIYCGPSGNIHAVARSGSGHSWLLIKPLSLDLRRVESIGSTLEKGLIYCATLAQKSSESSGRVPSFFDMRRAFSVHFVVSSSPKSKVSAILDGMRYAVNSTMAEFSGYKELLHSCWSRPLTTSLEVWLVEKSREIFLALSDTPVHVKRLGRVQGDQKSRFGAVTSAPSLVMEPGFSWQAFTGLKMEMYGLFFSCPKGLHGHTEVFRIQEETVEWQEKMDALEKEHEGLLKTGLGSNRRPCQQTFSKSFMELCGSWVSEQVQPFQDKITSKLCRPKFMDWYYLNPRNHSTKSMTKYSAGEFSSEKTIEEALRSLSAGKSAETAHSIALGSLASIPKVRLVRKNQRTERDRGIFVTDKATRAKLQIIEEVAEAVASHTPQEIISIGGDNKIRNVQDLITKALVWAAGSSEVAWKGGVIQMDRKIMFMSGDATKWSPGDNAMKFIPFVKSLTCLSPEVQNLLCHCIKSISQSELGLSDRVYQKLKSLDPSMSEKVSGLWKFFNLPEQRSGRIFGNWLQGNLNYLSSLVGCAALNLSGKVSRNIIGLECFFESLNHSDDSLTVIGWLKPKPGSEVDFECWRQEQPPKVRDLLAGDHWEGILAIVEQVCLHASIKLSTKKTFLSRTICEFVGVDFEAANPSMPYIKLALSSITELKVMGFTQDLASASSAAQKVLDMSGSLQLAQLVLSISVSRVRRGYGFQPGMVNDLSGILGVPQDLLPVALGGGGNLSIVTLSCGGLALFDVLTLKGCWTRFKRDGDMTAKRALQVHKAFRGATKFGESLMDKKRMLPTPQWRIFHQKSEDKSQFCASGPFCKRWGEENPEALVFEPLLPSGLFPWVSMKYLSPEVQNALCNQSEFVLRVRLMATCKSDVVRLSDDSEWISIKALGEKIRDDMTFQSYGDPDDKAITVLLDELYGKVSAWHELLDNTTFSNAPGLKRILPRLPVLLKTGVDSSVTLNRLGAVLAWGLMDKTEDKMRRLKSRCVDPDLLKRDHDMIRAKAELVRMDIGDVEDCLSILRVSAAKTSSRVVLCRVGTAPDPVSILMSWVRDGNLTGAVEVFSTGVMGETRGFFSDTSPTKDVEAGLKAGLTIWRFLSANKADKEDTLLWLNSLSVRGETLFHWFNQGVARMREIPKYFHAPVATMAYALLGITTLLDPIAREKISSGYFYRVIQKYNQQTRLYEGDLDVEFTFGDASLNLVIQGEKIRIYSTIDTTDTGTLSTAMKMVRTHLASCGRCLPVKPATEDQRGLIKNGSHFSFGFAKKGDWVVEDKVFIRVKMRLVEVPQTVDLSYRMGEEGLTVWGCVKKGKECWIRVASALHCCTDESVAEITARRELFIDGIRLDQLINRGYLHYLLRGSKPTLSYEDYTSIIGKKRAGRLAKTFVEIIETITSTVVDLGGILMPESCSATTAEEVQMEDYDFDEDCDFGDFSDDMTVGTLMLETEMRMVDREVLKPRGVSVLEEGMDSLGDFVRSWIKGGDNPASALNTSHGVLAIFAICNMYNTGLILPGGLRHVLTLENLLGPILEDVRQCGVSSAVNMVVDEDKMLLPHELRPYAGFDFEKVHVVLAKVFSRKRLNLYTV
ncbi:RNA-dependent RNA polymerase [Actinovirus bernense]|uniref:RNA-directed RNA polymerase L n=1 Tax=Bern perch virus TaxID=2675847 RepID=A0A6G5X254_9VIRU|nr:RNA-dependent RNA polymerase [Actinovirus bernense]QGM12349.1 RNA-dependent RNA polymerase [Actinovirus bernense]